MTSSATPAGTPACGFEIVRKARFDAAHALPAGPRAAYRRVHGHSFEVEAAVRGPLDAEVGWVVDLGALGAALDEAAAGLDHGLLNERPGLESPTLERLCLYFVEALRPAFRGLAWVAVARPSAGERCVLTL